jgi:hypothetical protein
MTILSGFTGFFTVTVSEPRQLGGHADCCVTGQMRLWLMALVVAGCGGVDRDIEDQITIEQGVYGLLIAGCDTAGCNDQPAAHEEVVVYVPGYEDQSVTSDGDGVYEVVLPAGDYTICTSSCTAVTVPTGIIRYDWTSGPGGGHWDPQQ